MDQTKRLKHDPTGLVNADIITVDSLVPSEVHKLFELATSFQNAPADVKPLGQGKIVALAFLEPSTRTSCSFAAAAQRLGCGVIYTNSTDSSITKGETLSDTIQCLSSYADAIVLRHPKNGAAQEAADSTDKPVLNAGDGTGEHPTQALLDLYTILRQNFVFSSQHKLNVTFLGDAKNGRTMHSLVKLLAKMYANQVRVRYVTPEELKMPQSLFELPGLEQLYCGEMTDDILHQTDVLYVTRVQKERFKDVESYQAATKKCFIVNDAVMQKLNPKAIVMHPLPRVDEISVSVDSDKRAMYFEQMKNGMFVRMALLAKVLGVEDN